MTHMLGGGVETVSMQIDQPQPLEWRASDQEALALCREWMIFLGAVDTIVATEPVRQVCDLYSSRFLAWVCNSRGNLGVDTVERAAAIATNDGRYPLIFLSAGVLPVTQDRADAVGLALLRFDAQGGNLDGTNRVGRELLLSGLAAS